MKRLSLFFGWCPAGGKATASKPTSGVRRLSSVVRPPSSGFTLVELMVVMAVIALLIMLFIPNVQKAREKAWSVSCQNNLRQYGIAMNQYLSVGSGGGNSPRGQFGIHLDEKQFNGGILPRNASPASTIVGPPVFANIAGYLPCDVTLQSLSAGQPSVRVCPVVLREILQNGNFFDPNSPNFKGTQDYSDGVDTYASADFEGGWIASTNLLNEGDTNSNYDAGGTMTLSSFFSTYAINPVRNGQAVTSIPENVIAYIDWNAREGWAATLNYTAWQFNGIDGQGAPVVEGTPKRADGAWWLTEVGFNHRSDSDYGANYVAMDGHIGWISSNAISVTNF